MNDISVLIGGKAGDGIREAGVMLAALLSELGYRIYHLYDYPSLIRGGHNFSLVRAAPDKVGAHRRTIDYLLALNQETVDLHISRLAESGVIIFDSNQVKAEGIGLPMGTMVEEEKAPPIVRSSCMIGCFARAAGIEREVVERVVRKTVPKKTDLNVKLAVSGYGGGREFLKIDVPAQPPLPVVSGNEAIGLGLISTGLDAYVAYPMTPASSILHFCAEVADDFSLKVVHPENEIAVMLMALGFSYAGKRVAVGTSGGGFCLMTEGLSLAGMAELPVVVIVSQRPGPSTGVPTYTAQGDLDFVLSAGHGEFPRLVVAPGAPEEAYYWSAVAMNMAWKWQMACIILVDKELSEGGYSFDIDSVADIPEEKPVVWDGAAQFSRYKNTESGVSPVAHPPAQGAIVKVSSYEHDEFGITTEVPEVIVAMQDKRLRKAAGIRDDMERYKCVNVFGSASAPVALVCWGSNRGVCEEAARGMDVRVVQPVLMSPFPGRQMREALAGAGKVVCMEHNATGQLAGLLVRHGFEVHKRIARYDGRGFSIEEMRDEMRRAFT